MTQNRFFIQFSSAALAILCAGALQSCNIYSGISTPSGDEQILSAARACFNQKDYACASEQYARLSTAQADTGTSESILAILDQNGVSMGTFMATMGSGGDVGKGINNLAASLTSGAGATRRVAMQSAFNSRTTISDANLKSFVGFLAAVSLTAEILAEAAGSNGTLEKTDLTRDPTACKALSETTCPLTTAGVSCSAPATSVLTDGDLTTTDIMTSDISGANPTLGQLFSALKYAYDSIGTLGASGDFSTFAATLQTIIDQGKKTGDGVTPGNCLRRFIISDSIGIGA